jgi:acyl transferase domain-containing protein/phosphopantetheinyl transferase (holo-ACP synthase)
VTVDTDVAIVGMACAFARAPDLASYWRNILGAVDAIGEPPDGWSAGGLAERHVYTRRGGYLGPLSFDPLAFGVMPKAVDGAEPDQFLALRLAAAALDDASYGRVTASRNVAVILGRGTYINRGLIGVFQHTIGIDQVLRVLRDLHPDWPEQQLDDLRQELADALPPFGPETAPGLAHSVMCGRIANRLDLIGPAYTVDAACASSLIAVEHGIDELLTGRADLVLAGGVQVSTTFPIAAVFAQLGALSPSGQLRPFQQGCDGTLLGEGAGIVVLQRRAEAERDGNRIYAVIKGVSSASDGKAVGVLAPRVEGEELAMRRAYERAAVDPRTVGLVEAHGTGTPAGDAVEIEAMARVFGVRGPSDQPSCAVGSVKSMIGHCLPAAGAAGLIKAALALHSKVLPATLHCDQPDERIDRTMLYLNDRTRPWVSGEQRHRRAAVSAFGFGGINAHAVLEEHDPRGPRERTISSRSPHVFRVPGNDREELASRCEASGRFAATSADIPLASIARSLAVADPGTGSCVAIVACSHDELRQKLVTAARRLRDPQTRRIGDRSGIYYYDRPMGREGRLAVLFPGEGSQHVGMFDSLCIEFPAARRLLDLLDTAFSDRSVPPSQEIFPVPGPDAGAAAELTDMQLAVASVSAADHAGLAVLDQLGLAADAVIGHSSGEYAALTAAGAADARDERGYLELVRDGDRLTGELLRQGLVPAATLTAVGGVSRDIVDEIVGQATGTVAVAMINCPHQIVLCGADDAICQIEVELARRGALCQRLPIGRAYHTERFRPVTEALRDFYDRLPLTEPRIPLYSATTAARMPADVAEIRRLTREQWCRPLRFGDAIEAMYADGIRLFLEVGPRGNLTAFVNDVLGNRPHVALAIDVPSRPSIMQFCHAAAQLVAHGVPLRLAELSGDAPGTPISPDSLFSSAARHAHRGQPLETELPMLRVSRAALTRWAAPPFSSAEADASPPLAAPAIDGSMPPARARLPDKAATGNVLAAYLTTMERFLETERAVMAAALDQMPARTTGNQPTSDGPANTVGQPPAAGTRTPLAPPGGREPAGGRPAGRLLAHASRPTHEADRVVFVKHIALDEDLFLRDHSLGASEGAALGILPLAISLELIAEAAGYLMPECPARTVHNVEACRWVLVTTEGVTLRITAYRASREEPPPPRMAKATVVLAVSRGGQWLDAVRAEVHVGPSSGDEPGPPDIPVGPLSEPIRPCLWGPADLYADRAQHGMFHGPTFQAVASVDGIGKEGADATLVAPAAALLPREADNYRTDPVILDGAGQVLGYWAAQELSSSFVVFPVTVRSISLPPPGRPRPAELRCRARVTQLTDQHLVADIDVTGPGGSPWLIVRSWRVRRFTLPPKFFDFRIDPVSRFLGEELASVPVPGLPAARIMRVELPADLLVSDGGVWSEILAYLALHSSEHPRWRELSEGISPARRTEWLLGRVAVKDAVRSVLGADGSGLAPGDLAVVSSDRGVPAVRAPGRPELRARLDCMRVSLSHSDGEAVAVAAEADGLAGIGIDAERLGERRHPIGQEALAAAALTADEQALASRAADPQELRLRLWCAKEAYAKATGAGLLAYGGPRGLTTRPLDGDGQFLVCSANDGDNPVPVVTARQGDLIVAVARWPP